MTDSAPPGQPPTDEEAQWGMYAWLGALVLGIVTCGLGFLAPLGIMMTRGKESTFVLENSREALNVAITVIIGYAGAFVLQLLLGVIGSLLAGPIALLGFLGWILAVTAAIYGLVFTTLGAIAANNGETYRAPFAIRLVK